MMNDNQRKLDECNAWIDESLNFITKLSAFSEATVAPRRFKGKELQEVLDGVPLSTISMAHRENRLPPRDRDSRNRALGATLAQVKEMQRYFNTSPERLPNEPPQIICFSNLKGGCYKSTTSLYAGAYYANLGYRVLLGDLDPQATLTLNVGIMPDIDTNYDNTIAQFIINDAEYDPDEIRKLIRKTYNVNMDILPSCIEMESVDTTLANEVAEAKFNNDIEGMANCFFRVRQVMDAVKDDYDIVILDGTPSLGLLALNIILAADTVIVPLPTEPVDFASTRSFAKLYKQQAETLLAHFSDVIKLPEMYILPTRFSPSDKTAAKSATLILSEIRRISRISGLHCFETVIRKHEAVVSNLSLFRRTVFDVNPNDCNVSSESRKKAMANFSTAFEEILEKVVFPKWESKRGLLEERGITHV